MKDDLKKLDEIRKDKFVFENLLLDELHYWNLMRRNYNNDIFDIFQQPYFVKWLIIYSQLEAIALLYGIFEDALIEYINLIFPSIAGGVREK